MMAYLLLLLLKMFMMQTLWRRSLEFKLCLKENVQASKTHTRQLSFEEFGALNQLQRSTYHTQSIHSGKVQRGYLVFEFSSQEGS